MRLAMSDPGHGLEVVEDDAKYTSHGELDASGLDARGERGSLSIRGDIVKRVRFEDLEGVTYNGRHVGRDKAGCAGEDEPRNEVDEVVSSPCEGEQCAERWLDGICGWLGRLLKLLRRKKVGVLLDGRYWDRGL